MDVHGLNITEEVYKKMCNLLYSHETFLLLLQKHLIRTL